MRIDGLKFSGLGFVLGVIVYELYLKRAKGKF